MNNIIKIFTLLLLLFILCSSSNSAAISSLNGTTIGGSTGNYSNWNGTVLGTSAGDVSYWNDNSVSTKINPTLSVTNSPQIWTGYSIAVTVSGSVSGTVSNVLYDGSSTVPINSGTYAITADFVPDDTTHYNNLTGASAGDFVINQSGIDSYTKLMLHMDGTNGGTTFNDSEIAPTKTVTPHGTAQTGTAQKVFGTASSYTEATGDFLSIPDSDDWYMGTGDFTIDCWIWLFAYPAASSNKPIFGQATDSSNFWFVSIYNLSGSMKLRFRVYSGTIDVALINTVTPALNTWYHIAIVRYGNNIKMFWGGNQLGTDQAFTDEIPNLTGLAYVGEIYPSSGQNYFGRIDELRISKGIARWTTNFTPSTSAYTE